MSKQASFARFVITSMVLLAFVAVGYVAGQRGLSPSIEPTAHANSPAFPVWESATRGNQMSLATGHVKDVNEAVFALDHLTGDLFCWLLSPTEGVLAPTRAINVSNFLNVDGDADYMMCTGLLDIRVANTGGDRVGESVVYVGDGNSGRVAAFTVFYGNGLVRLEHIPGSSGMMTRDPRTVRDQGDGK